MGIHHQSVVQQECAWHTLLLHADAQPDSMHVVMLHSDQGNHETGSVCLMPVCRSMRRLSARQKLRRQLSCKPGSTLLEKLHAWRLQQSNAPCQCTRYRPSRSLKLRKGISLIRRFNFWGRGSLTPCQSKQDQAIVTAWQQLVVVVD